VVVATDIAPSLRHICQWLLGRHVDGPTPIHNNMSAINNSEARRNHAMEIRRNTLMTAEPNKTIQFADHLVVAAIMMTL